MSGLHWKAISGQSPVCVGITPLDFQDMEMPIMFFIVGSYHDLSTRSIVLEAYASIMRNDIPILHPDDFISATTEMLRIWKGMLPSMVESAGEWDHKASCEYKTEGIPLAGQNPICSCGVGKVGENFKNVKKWKEYLPHVTKVAIRPVFDIPWFGSGDGGKTAIMPDTIHAMPKSKTKTNSKATMTATKTSPPVQFLFEKGSVKEVWAMPVGWILLSRMSAERLEGA
jgi:hypothetical protein